MNEQEHSKGYLIFCFALYLLFALFSMLVFLYSSFALSAANILVMVGTSFALASPKFANGLAKVTFIFFGVYVGLVSLEIFFGGREGTGFGYGSGGIPYRDMMNDGKYTYYGMLRVSKAFAFAVFLYWVGEVFRRESMPHR